MKKISFLILFLSLSSCKESNVSDPIQDDFNQTHSQFLKENKKRAEKVLSNGFHYSGIEVIYVQSGESYYSWFGHVLLKFVGSAKNPKDDISISFIGDFNEVSMDIKKAYFGGYKTLIVIKKFREFIDEYTQKEGRYIERHIIPTSTEERSKILSVLRSWIKRPELAGDYAFRRNGCTALILKLLAKAIPEISPTQIAFPIEVIDYLKSRERISYSFEKITKRNYLEKSNQTLNEQSYQL